MRHRLRPPTRTLSGSSDALLGRARCILLAGAQLTSLFMTIPSTVQAQDDLLTNNKPPSTNLNRFSRAFAASDASSGASRPGGLPRDEYLSEEDYGIIASVEPALRGGLELQQRWTQLEHDMAFQKRFELVRTFNSPNESFGFFDQAQISSTTLPIMGESEDRLFDYSSPTDIRQVCKELREFVLKYLLRASDFRRPDAYSESDSQSPACSLNVLGLCPVDDPRKYGFGYAQHYHKLLENGEARGIPSDKRFEIDDLRQLGTKYEWIVLRVRIFDFTIRIRLLGSDGPRLTLPLEESSFLVLSPEFIVDQTQTEVDVRGRKIVGRYGFGYAFIRDSTDQLLGYGPGQFDVAFQQIVFTAYDDGEIRVKLVFVANRPQKITNVSFAPFDWGATFMNMISRGLTAPFFAPIRPVLQAFPLNVGSFDPVSIAVDVANIVTNGEAARRLCLSHEQLERTFLVKHFDQHYEMISGALQTWRAIRDWTDEASIPNWVKSGVSS